MSTPTTPAARPAIWAEAGTMVEPDTGSQQTGYVAGKPGRGKTNWLFNWLDNAVQWLLAQMSIGIQTYNNGVDYAVGARVQSGSTHDAYQALQENGPGTGAGVKALTDTDYWERWGYTASDLNDGVNTIVDGAIGTLSGDTASGIALSGGATVSNAHHLNFPGTTHKILMMTVRVVVSGGVGATTVTLSGDTAFATEALNVVASNADTQALPSDVGIHADVSSAQTVNILVSGFGSYTHADVGLLISGS